MKLEQQVVSLELAKRMKELGFKQESLWWWVCHHGVNNTTNRVTSKPWGQPCRNIFDYTHHSAYTVAELGEMLPDFIKEDGEIYTLRQDRILFNSDGSKKFNPIWLVCYYPCNEKITETKIYTKANTEASARAKMLIYLKEQN